MRQKPAGCSSSSEQIIRDIKRKTRKRYNAEEKIRIVLDRLRGEESIAELCRRRPRPELVLQVVHGLHGSLQEAPGRGYCASGQQQPSYRTAS